MINLFQPSVGEAEVNAIREVFASNWLGPGTQVRAFEQMFAGYIGRPADEFLALTSCTEALFQAISSLGVGPADEVILPSVSFVGAGHAVRSAGAQIVLCDVDPETLNPQLEHFERAITSKTKAAIILHYGGRPGAVAEIAALAKSRSISLIEDAAISLGSISQGKACGTFGDVGCWSFDSMKTLSTGDGGMLWTRNPEIIERVRNNIRLGVCASGFHRRGHSREWWEVEPSTAGRWATMNDITAAMGLVQLDRVPGFLRRREELSARYDAELCDLAWLRLPRPAPHQTARTFYWIQTAPGIRDRLAQHLLQSEIYTSFRYWPLHRMRMYLSSKPFPGADLATASTLLLPLHQGLSDSDAEQVIAAVRAFSP